MSIAIRKKPLILTARLCLRPLCEGDTEALIDLMTNAEVTKTYMIPTYGSREEYLPLAGKLIAFSAPADTARLVTGICLGPRLIGWINSTEIRDDLIEIGYVMHPDHWGKGYTTEAVTALLPELRDMGFRTVRAGYFEENPASGRVMEKCGMQSTGTWDPIEYRGVTHKCLYREITF